MVPDERTHGGIALTVTLPVLVAILATVGGIAIVGVGGGLIKPMQERWEGYLASAESSVTERATEKVSEWADRD